MHTGGSADRSRPLAARQTAGPASSRTAAPGASRANPLAPFDHNRILARRLGSFGELSPRELEGFAALQSAPLRVQRGEELFHDGEAGQRAYVLLSGWGCSFKLLPDGGRQVIRFPLPGDFIGVRSALLHVADHSCVALTDVVATRIEAGPIRRMLVEMPRLGVAILWATSQAEAMNVEHLVSLGRRSAAQRMAHFFLELQDRLQRVGLAPHAAFACPLNQYVLADALGLSAIHVNRVLRQLRERSLLTLKDGTLTIHDMPALEALAGYQRLEQGGDIQSHSRAP